MLSKALTFRSGGPMYCVRTAGPGTALRGARVVLHHHVDGSMHVRYKGLCVAPPPAVLRTATCHENSWFGDLAAAVPPFSLSPRKRGWRGGRVAPLMGVIQAACGRAPCGSITNLLATPELKAA